MGRAWSAATQLGAGWPLARVHSVQQTSPHCQGLEGVGAGVSAWAFGDRCQREAKRVADGDVVALAQERRQMQQYREDSATSQCQVQHRVPELDERRHRVGQIPIIVCCIRCGAYAKHVCRGPADMWQRATQDRQREGQGTTSEEVEVTARVASGHGRGAGGGLTGGSDEDAGVAKFRGPLVRLRAEP